MDVKSQTKAMKDTAQDALDTLQDKGEEIQSRLGEFWETGRERATEYAKATDKAIRSNPYQSIGIALGIGLLAGLLLNRNRSSRNYED
ncbi:MAG: hypothetical protein JWR26_3424 [Pedosphaera sp.]|nr:hypothetical protein [Pedosphaera sp.]